MIFGLFGKNNRKESAPAVKDDFKEKIISLIRGFSEEELSINGWRKIDAELAFYTFKGISNFIKEGNYLELGCGSGMLCLFLRLLFGRNITPYGVDINAYAIEGAKKNNPEYAGNFVADDYFSFLENNYSSLGKFSTISIFVNGDSGWEGLLKIAPKIIRDFPKMRLIVCDYDDALLSTDSEYVSEFISKINKISNLIVVNNSLIVIGLEGELLCEAEKMREEALKCDAGSGRCEKEVVTGTISKKEKDSFIISFDKHEERFSLNDNVLFAEIRSSDHLSQEERGISWEGIKEGDKVVVMVSRGKNSRIFGVKKILTE